MNRGLIKAATTVQVAALKQRVRALRRHVMRVNRTWQMPKIRVVPVNANYINPVTLEAPPKGVVVYKVHDPVTGRLDYYNKVTFWRLVGRSAKNNWNLFVNRKKRLFVNPVTRAVIQAKNVERVVVRPKPKTPSRSAAAAKIKNALRKKLVVKKAASTRKPASPKKKTPARKSH